MDEKKQKGKGGRPVKHDIDADEVYKLAGLGCSTTEIGAWFKVHPNIIRSRFQEEIDRGKSNMRITLRRAQLKLAVGGNATMCIWLGKQLLNQTDDGTIDGENLVGEITFGDVVE